MRSDIKKRWVEALRSGEYTQTGGSLHRISPINRLDGKEIYPAGYCCLGVLCELAKQDGVIASEAETGQAARERYDEQATYLPKAVADWAEIGNLGRLNTLDGVDVYLPSQDELLSSLNDAGVSFKTIAGLIERDL